MINILRVAFAAVAISCVYAEIVQLNEKSFKELVENDSSDSIWFLDFYAPWCGHCKRLDPVLDELQFSLPKNVKIGKIDATTEKRLAAQYHVSGFPTLKYRKDGKFFEYEGGRDLDSLKALFARLQAPAVAEIATGQDMKNLLEQHNVVFLLYNPRGDEAIANAFLTVATEMQARGTFAATSSADVVQAFKLDSVDSSDGFLVRLEADQLPLYYTTAALTDDNAMLAFAEKHNHDFVNHLSQFNYRTLSNKGKTMSVLLVNYDDPTHKETLRSYKAAAKSLAEDGMNEFVFGHIDGVRWEKYFSRFDVAQPLPKLLFTRPEAEVFFHDPSVDLTDEQAIRRAMHAVISGETKLHKISWTTTFKVLKSRLFEGGQTTWMVVLSILSICVTIWLASPRGGSTASSNEITDGEQEEQEEKEGDEGKSDGSKKSKKSKSKSKAEKPKED